MKENRIATQVIGASIEVHRILGPGLLEAAYQDCLAHELELRGLQFETETPVPVKYKGIEVGEAYRADFIVENILLLEIKTVESLQPVHKAQLLTYLRLTNRRLGLVLNFNVDVLKKGIRRVANSLY